MNVVEIRIKAVQAIYAAKDVLSLSRPGQAQCICCTFDLEFWEDADGEKGDSIASG